MTLIPPYRPAQPQLLWGLVHWFQRAPGIVERGTVASDEERTILSHVLGVLEEGIGAVHDASMTDQISRSHTRVRLKDMVRSHNALLHFGKESVGITDDAGWRDWFALLCGNLRTLRDLIAAVPVPEERRMLTRDFLVLLSGWVTNVVRTQMDE